VADVKEHQEWLFPRYPNVPGFKRPGTSEQAAREVESEASHLRAACYRCLLEQPSTADEVAAKLGRSVLAIRPRISELVAKFRVIETPQRRKNVSGKWAAVWKVNDNDETTTLPANGKGQSGAPTQSAQVPEEGSSPR
jgi:hypothetical protein